MSLHLVANKFARSGSRFARVTKTAPRDRQPAVTVDDIKGVIAAFRDLKTSAFGHLRIAEPATDAQIAADLICRAAAKARAASAPPLPQDERAAAILRAAGLA
jgi:hypothetical protein